ncbi:MAG: hypothetical protein GXP56_13285 [Deltaproteobacteria bacterium]|nr:hypothetical protein [Deltaproteobacteria bacterium]
MKACKFFHLAFYRQLIRFLPVGILISLILIISPNTRAFSKALSIQELNTMVVKIKKDAEKQITAIHGLQAMSLIKNRLQKEYHLNTLPLPGMAGPCPAIGYGKKDVGNTIEAKALNQSGVYYIFGVKAMLKNHLFIAKWGFAKASLMNMKCPSNISNLGFTLNACKEYEHAIAILNYAKTLDPADSSIYVNLAYSYRKLHRYNEAINEMMIAVSFQPGLKKYKEILDELKKLKKEEKKYQIIGKQKKNTASGLEDALDLLEDRKAEELNKEPQYVFNPSFPSNNGSSLDNRNWRNEVIDMVHSYDTSAFAGEGDAVCGYFKKQAYLLVRMGDGLVEKAGGSPPGGNPIEKFISTGLAHMQKRKDVVAKIDSKSYNNRLDLIKDFASIGALETANIFYGIAGEMYEMCGKIEADPDMDRFLDNLINERIKSDKDFFKNLDKEKFSKPVCTYKICISRGGQGSTKISITDPWFDTEIRLHPTNIYKYQLKVSKGGNLFKKTIGNIASGSLSCSTYLEWKFGRGMSAGTELNIGGAAGKYVTTKAGKPISLVKYSLEN